MEKRKIRVLECIRQGQVGGGESHLLSLVGQLNKDIFEPIVLSFTEGPMVDRLRAMGIEAHVIYTEKPFDFRIWKRVKAFIASQQVDLIHAHGTRANSNIIWAAKQLHIPVIYTIHGWSFHDDQSFLTKTFRTLGEKYLTRSSVLNISVSKSNQETGQDRFSGFSSIVINNGISLSAFDPETTQSSIRAELGIPESHLLLVFIARLTTQKQPQALIKAFDNIRKEYSDISLLMIGEGDEQTDCDQLVSQLGINHNFHLLPFRQDIPQILRGADVYVLPSLWEGLPIGLLEAMAMEKAIIATHVDGTKEIIRHNETGYLIDVADIENQLVVAIKDLYANPAKRSTLGNKARMLIKENFSVEFMTKRVEEEYLKFCNR